VKTALVSVTRLAFAGESSGRKATATCSGKKKTMRLISLKPEYRAFYIETF